MINLNPIDKVIQLSKIHQHYGGYRNYTSTIQKMKKDGVWQLLHSEYAHTHIDELSDIYDVKKGTMKQWHYNLKRNLSWIPDHLRNPDSYVFTPDEERRIVDIINFVINQHLHPITNNFIRAIMLSYYISYKEPNEKRQFSASNKYIRRFKRRYDFSTRRLHFKRRPNASDQDVIKFLTKVCNVFSIAEKDHIVNTDETMWRCEQSRLTTWAKKGSDGVVVYSGDSDKEGFTTLASITAAGDILPLLLIAGGVTTRCETNWFGQNRNVTKSIDDENEDLTMRAYSDHSIKGWTTRDTWKRYLNALRYRFIKPTDGLEFYDQRNRIYLLTDSYPVHICDECVEYANALNIDIIQIPKGTTDLFQPLDKKIFGILKSKACAYINKVRSDEILKCYDVEKAKFMESIPPPRKISKQEAASVLEEAWNKLSKETIISSWEDSLTKHFKDFSKEEKKDFKIKSESELRGKIINNLNNTIITSITIIEELKSNEDKILNRLDQFSDELNESKKNEIYETRKQIKNILDQATCIYRAFEQIKPENEYFGIFMDMQIALHSFEFLDLLKETEKNQSTFIKDLILIQNETPKKINNKIKKNEELKNKLLEKVQLLIKIRNKIEPQKDEKEDNQQNQPNFINTLSNGNTESCTNGSSSSYNYISTNDPTIACTPTISSQSFTDTNTASTSTNSFPTTTSPYPGTE